MPGPQKDVTPPMNIYQRLNEVRKRVKYVQKDATVRGAGSYKAVSHDAVTAAVREYLTEFGVMIVPTLVKSEFVDTGSMTGGGTRVMRYDATYRISFVNVDDPGDRFEVEIEAQALDHGDKAPGKAISYAVKYAILKVLSLETGEDEESRLESKPRPVTKAQAEVIHNLLAKCDESAQDYFSQNYGRPEDVSVQEFDSLVVRLEKAAGKAAKES